MLANGICAMTLIYYPTYTYKHQIYIQRSIKLSKNQIGNEGGVLVATQGMPYLSIKKKICWQQPCNAMISIIGQTLKNHLLILPIL